MWSRFFTYDRIGKCGSCTALVIWDLCIQEVGWWTRSPGQACLLIAHNSTTPFSVFSFLFLWFSFKFLMSASAVFFYSHLPVPFPHSHSALSHPQLLGDTISNLQSYRSQRTYVFSNRKFGCSRDILWNLSTTSSSFLSLASIQSRFSLPVHLGKYCIRLWRISEFNTFLTSNSSSPSTWTGGDYCITLPFKMSSATICNRDA